MGRAQDARSDIFSLGVLFYETLTGISPFAADSLQKVCNHVLSSRPLPPSQVNSSIPRELDEILAKCLAKDPQQRMASAEVLAEHLYPLARKKTVTPAVAPAVEPTLRNRAARFLRSA